MSDICPIGDQVQLSVESLKVTVEDGFRDNREVHDRLEDGVSTVRKTLFGNGEVGLTERVRALEQVSRMLKKLLLTAALGVAGLFGTLIWQVIVFYLKHE